MEAGEVIGNDKVVGVCVWVESGGLILCVAETCWGTVIECGLVCVLAHKCVS